MDAAYDYDGPGLVISSADAADTLPANSDRGPGWICHDTCLEPATTTTAYSCRIDNYNGVLTDLLDVTRSSEGPYEHITSNIASDDPSLYYYGLRSCWYSQ